MVAKRCLSVLKTLVLFWLSCSHEKIYQALLHTHIHILGEPRNKATISGLSHFVILVCAGKHFYIVYETFCGHYDIYTGPPGNTTVFQNVPSGFYYLCVTATSGPEEGEVTWKVYMYVPTTSSICSVNLINTGLVVDGTSVSMEFRGMGPTSVFTCRLDDGQFHSCELYCVD